MNGKELIISTSLKFRNAIKPFKKHLNKGATIDFNKASILHVIVYNETIHNEILSFTDEIRKNRDKNTFIVINNGILKNKIAGTQSITLHDLTLSGAIKIRLKELINNCKANVLLCYSTELSLFHKTIISNLDADYKAGQFKTDTIDLFDLTLDSVSDILLEKFKNFEQYLNNLNINR